jgi:hypothetical protein
MTDELRDLLKGRPTAELVEILRNYDLTEWRPEVFPVVEAILQDRGLNTDAFKAAGPPRGHAVETVVLESVASFGSPLEANLCRMALLEAGIKTWLSTEDLGGMAPPLGWASGVEVLVRRDQAPAAREVLAAVEAGAAELPEEPETGPQA